MFNDNTQSPIPSIQPNIESHIVIVNNDSVDSLNNNIEIVNNDKTNDNHPYEVVLFIRYKVNLRPSIEYITNFFNKYGLVHHVNTPVNKNFAFVFMTNLNTDVEHRRTRTIIDTIIRDMLLMSIETRFYITVANSNSSNNDSDSNNSYPNNRNLYRNNNSYQNNNNSYRNNNSYGNNRNSYPNNNNSYRNNNNSYGNRNSYDNRNPYDNRNSYSNNRNSYDNRNSYSNNNNDDNQHNRNNSNNQIQQ